MFPIFGDCEKIVYSSETTLYQVLKDVFYTVLGIDEIDEMITTTINVSTSLYNHQELTIKDYLLSIKIPSFTLEKDTLTNQINKICTVAQLHFYQDDYGNYKFVNARPLAIDSELDNGNPIEIRYYQQYGRPKSTILVANRYDEVVFR